MLRATGQGDARSSPPPQSQRLQRQLVELQAHRHIGAAAAVARFLEIVIVEAQDVPADQDPAILERLDAQVGTARISEGPAADARTDCRRAADIEGVGPAEADVAANDVAPALDVVLAIAVGDVTGAPE